MTTSSKLDENWTKTTDAAERRRIQNRLAQRNYRNNIKQRLRQLEQLDKAFLKSVNLNAATMSGDENDEDGVLPQQQNTTTYPVSQPVVTQPDDKCYWLSSQNEISVSGHAEIQMDMTTQIEPSQYMFGLNTPHTNRSPSPPSQSQSQSQQQYNYFGVGPNPSPPQEQHSALTYDRESSGRTDTSAGTKPNSATQTGLSVGSVPTQIHSHANSHSQPPVYRMHTPPSSEKDYKLNAGSHLRYISKKDPALKYTTSPANSVNPGNHASCTPLHQAAAHGHLQIVRFLLLKGANLTAQNEAGQTVLHLAAERGHDAVIEHALSQDVISQFSADGQMGGGGARAFINGVDGQGFTALHRAAAGGHEECVRALVEAGAEIESNTCTIRSTMPACGGGAFSGSQEETF